MGPLLTGIGGVDRWRGETNAGWKPPRSRIPMQMQMRDPLGSAEAVAVAEAVAEADTDTDTESGHGKRTRKQTRKQTRKAESGRDRDIPLRGGCHAPRLQLLPWTLRLAAPSGVRPWM
jgi:hypothetical protein